jgi:predicted ATPase
MGKKFCKLVEALRFFTANEKSTTRYSMLIAISGSHSLGKSTMVNDFIEAHPEFIYELEPYRALRDKYDIKFAKESTQHCADVQVDYLIERMKSHSKSDQVIFDRCLIDFLPYCQYTAKYAQTDIENDYLQRLAKKIRENIHYIDLIIFLPITDKHLIHLEDDGIRPTDVEYRSEVDEYFKEIYRKNAFDLLSLPNAPRVVEMWGPRKERINKLDKLVWG